LVFDVAEDYQTLGLDFQMVLPDFQQVFRYVDQIGMGQFCGL